MRTWAQLSGEPWEIEPGRVCEVMDSADLLAVFRQTSDRFGIRTDGGFDSLLTAWSDRLESIGRDDLVCVSEHPCQVDIVSAMNADRAAR